MKNTWYTNSVKCNFSLEKLLLSYGLVCYKVNKSQTKVFVKNMIILYFLRRLLCA